MLRMRFLLLFAGLFAVTTLSACGQEAMRLWSTDPPESNELGGAETGDGCIGNISTPTLTVYQPDPEIATGTAVLVIPGGGYRVVCMDHEGKAIARWLNSIGITAGVLKYRLPNVHYAVPFQDAQQALRMLRANADEYGIDRNRVGVLGFSAGGHLASTIGTHFNEDFSSGRGDNLAESNRPDFMILVYPVVTMQAGLTHNGSRTYLLGDAPNDEMVMRFSNEQQVSGDTPPTFVVHATDDGTVPVLNSINLYEALIAAGVSAEMHIFEHGGHGFALKDGPARKWTDLAEDWLQQFHD